MKSIRKNPVMKEETPTAIIVQVNKASFRSYSEIIFVVFLRNFRLFSFLFPMMM